MERIQPYTSVWHSSHEAVARQLREAFSLGPPSTARVVDVCVVGAGIAGLSTAYQLACEGAQVVVLEARWPGGGNTQYTTAHLASALDDRFSVLERLRGHEVARLAAGSHQAAIDEIERIVGREGIACNFERLDGYLFAAAGEWSEALDDEFDAARRAGLEVEKIPAAPLAYPTGPALRFARQGQSHPLAYLAGLAHAIRKAGGRLYAGARARVITKGDDVKVEVAGETIRAEAIVVATNTPISDKVALHSKQAPYTTYVVAIEVPLESVQTALYWDTADPYHYVRLQHEGDGRALLIVGGEDHKTGQGNELTSRHKRLEAWARERFPDLGSVTHRWAGQVYETLDGLAYLGYDPGIRQDEARPGRVFIATGDSGMGMTHGTIAGTLLRDLILRRSNPYQALYDPARKPPATARDYAKENLNVLGQYTDWLTGGEIGSPEELDPGQGAILRRGLKKVAAYRDADGKLHERSATCPHLGCIVRWNEDARSWDCPCHGSRFDARGRVFNGPANDDLGSA